ncbi:MAG: NrpR regulatory domain-containing protein [Dehalococcoidales bacterium]|nr:NrpR regulatory domain-containing protein [Dehalococcoidales bacterium]
MLFNGQEVERKLLTILQILRDTQEPVGARVIGRHLKEHGVELTERAVRYHLKAMDQRGLTELVGRDGRLITEKGIAELGSALVRDKVGLAFHKIEVLAFRTNFNFDLRSGLIPVNISLFPVDSFDKALQLMKPIFRSDFCVSDLVAVAKEGETLGELVIPPGMIGLATVCSIVINGSLLKAGVPMGSRFGGILQMQKHRPYRFAELIYYSGSSIDPSEVFIKARMTSVHEAVKYGEGRILANFREIPAACRSLTEDIINKLREARMGGILLMGNTSEPVCEIQVDLNRIGIVVLGGLNPVAAVAEGGIEVTNHAMSTVMEYQKLTRFQDTLSLTHV